MKRIVAAIALLGLTACTDVDEDESDTLSDFNVRLEKLYAGKPDDTARAYALVKDGLAGEDWLATIHGYADNQSVCEELIAPYNDGSSTTVLPGDYRCKELVRKVGLD